MIVLKGKELIHSLVGAGNLNRTECSYVNLKKTIDTYYADFDSLHDRKWIGNCPYYEIRDSYNGKQSYAKIFDVTEEKVDLELKEFPF